MSGGERVAASVRLAVALYGRLTRLLPRDLYREYGAAMVADYGDVAAAAHAAGGALRVWRSLLLAAHDVVRGGVREWWIERVVRRPAAVRGVRAERVRIGDEMSNWLYECRLAARALAQRPGFTLTVVLTLALGIGANVAIFAIVNSILIRPLPYAESDRIVWIRHHAPGLDLPELENSAGTLALYEQHARSFRGLAAANGTQRNLTGGREPARIEVLEATPSLFDVLRVRPRLGRRLVEDDARPGAPPVAVLSHGAWSAYFGAAPDIVGRTVRLNDVATQIVGVMPADFSFPVATSAAALLPIRPDPRGRFGDFGFGVMARLAPGVDLDAAQQEVTALQQRIPELYPDVPLDFLRRAGWSASVRTLRDVTVADARMALWIVLGTVGFLLLVACASVANLFLVRAEARQREIGIRLALGAVRARIAATYLYESMLVGVAGGVWGTVAAWFALRALVAAGPPQLPRLEEIQLDATTLVFAAAVSLGAGILFGVLPLARQMTLPLFGLTSGRGHTAGRERQRARQALIVTQIALALVLLTGSGLMLRSFQRLRAVDPGFDAPGVLTVGISLGNNRSKAEAAALTRQVLDQVRRLPGVRSAGAANALPLDPSGMNGGSFAIRSRPRPDDALPPVAMYSVITDGFHETMATPLVAGRALAAADEDGPPVVLVNETFARSFLDGRALGERISFGSDTVWHEIVGVVGDVRTFGLRDDIRPTAYLPITTPISGARATLMHVAVRASAEPIALASLVRAVVQRVAPDVPLTAARTMQHITDDALAETSFTTTILTVAALVALALGAVGLYGVIGYVVSQRTKEIGVRIALGAVPASVRRMVLRQGLLLAGFGTAIGLAGAVLLSRLLEAVLFEIDSRDPATFLLVAAALLLVSALAAYAPARRAAAVSPLEALRAE